MALVDAYRIDESVDVVTIERIDSGVDEWFGDFCVLNIPGKTVD